ncbi:MAG: FAD-binding protein [Pseudomonadota bacterium]
MKRRDFLHTLAATTTTSLAPLASANPIVRRVRPGEAGWPSAESWARLNQEVGGTLQRVAPVFGACAGAAASAACGDERRYHDNPYWIGDQAGGTQNSGWLDAWRPALSAYAVKARNAGDVAAAVNFARKNALRLVVKGGGHSYLGTSNAPDSLLVWTRALNSVKLHEAFVPIGCEGRLAPVPAVSAGAGAMWIDLYHAVTTRAGRYVQGGGCMTVGVAGLVQSGGFNSFSKCFGTAAANLLEAEIVSADGQVKVVNPARDPDLFWAIKGGGGGTFGVVTRVTLRTHDLPVHFGAAWGKIKATSDAAFVQLIARFMDLYQQALFNPHWGEHVHLGPDNTLELNMISQGLDSSEVHAVWRPFFAWVKSSPELFTIASPVGCDAWHARGWWDVEKNQSMAADPRPGAPSHHGWTRGDIGELSVLLHGYDSLWLPAALLEQRKTLDAALFAASRHQMLRLFFGKGLAGATPAVREAALQTATNPAVVDAFVLVIIADGEKAADPAQGSQPGNLQGARGNADAIAKAAATLRRIAPHSGSYVSESNYFNPNWQQEYWGANYARLQAIKAKADPDGLFYVYHGVGSEAWSDNGFTRRALG